MAIFDKMNSVCLLSLLLLAIPTTNAIPICPADCTCIPLNITDSSSSQQLHAKCNSLSGLDSKLRFDSIKSIDCSRIGLETINDQFAKLTNLVSIDLSHNKLTRVPPRLGRNVHTIDLSYNRIASEKINRIPSSVRNLNVEHNSLTEVPSRLLQLDHLKRLDLTGNVIKCNCDTLNARNWLSSKGVKATLFCSSTAYKNRSWDEINISEVCVGHVKDIWDIESNLMLNDQPMVKVDSVDFSEEEFGKDYLPYERRVFKRQLDEQENNDSVEGSGMDATESDLNGSGDSEITSLSIGKTRDLETTTADDQEGSGSNVPLISLSSSDVEISSTSTPTTDLYDDEMLLPHTLGIFREATLHKFDETTPIDTTTEEDAVLARMPNSLSSAPMKNAPATTEGSVDSSESTYALLVILGILLVGLIAFVVIRKKTSRARREADAENANGKEMLVMSKERLGKPINGNNGNHNGGEVVPLIGERDQWNPRQHHQVTRPEQEDLQSTQQPLLHQIEEPVHNEPSEHANYSEPSRPSSVVSKHENNNNNEDSPKSPENPDLHINNNAPIDSTFAPVSPKPARYSPVYSPVTGRVKIKLAETPKPRTPMLVNRTRSNAGDIITTAVHKPH